MTARRRRPGTSCRSSSSPVAPRPREGPLTEPRAVAQPWRRERVLMPQSRHPSLVRGSSGWGGRGSSGDPTFCNRAISGTTGLSATVLRQQIGLCEKALRSGPYGGSRQESILVDQGRGLREQVLRFLGPVVQNLGRPSRNRGSRGGTIKSPLIDG